MKIHIFHPSMRCFGVCVLEKDEKGFLFSAFRSGKLDKKISKTDSAVTFCNTVPLSAQMHNRGIEYDAISNIVFKKEGKICVRQV